MHALYAGQHDNQDLSGPLDLVTITASSGIVITANINISNVSGVGGNYTFQLFLNGSLIVPDRTISVAGGLTEFVIQSRQVFLVAGDTLSFRAQGLSGDTNASIRIVMLDVTPVHADEVTEQIGEPLATTVVDALAEHEIIVHPTKTVLGACEKQVQQVPTVFEREVVQIPVVKNNS